MLLNSLKLNWILLVTTILFLYCSYSQCKPTNIEQLTEHELIDHFYPTIFVTDEFVERAAPHFGRALSRHGRRTATNIVPYLYHAGRYYIEDDDTINDKRAAPRYGRRSI